MIFPWQNTLKGVFEVGAQVSTIFGFAYALFWLERYRKQKIVEHQSDNARKALDELVLIEEMFDTLFAAGSKEVTPILHKSLPNSLREIYKALLLLREIPGIPEQLKLFEKLGDTVQSKKAHPEVALAEINQLYAPLGGYKQAVKRLKEHLVRIYVLRA